MKNLIGTEIGVLDENGKEIKKIIIKDAKQSGEKWIFSDDAGNLYSEEELNFTYKITPKGILYLAFNKYLSEYMYLNCFDAIWNEFEYHMKLHGYIQEDENN